LGRWEAEREPWLRERMGEFMRGYRTLLAEMIRREQEAGPVPREVSPDGLATLLAAMGDGLLMHALLDPTLGVSGAIDALQALVRRAGPP
jgi:hypothetical protein